jgi:hypothetical protein
VNTWLVFCGDVRHYIFFAGADSMLSQQVVLLDTQGSNRHVPNFAVWPWGLPSQQGSDADQGSAVCFRVVDMN